MDTPCEKIIYVKFDGRYNRLLNDMESTFKKLQDDLDSRADIINQQHKNIQDLVERMTQQEERISSLLVYQKTSNIFAKKIQRLWRGFIIRKSIKLLVTELKYKISLLTN